MKKEAVEKKGKKKGVWKKVLIVIAAVISCLIITGIVLFKTFVYRTYNGLPVSGSYEFAAADAILVDSSRVEAFEEDGSFREVPITIYYPLNAKEGEKFPLVLFSHGAFGVRLSNYSTYSELASNGYVVIAMDHPYHSFFTEDTDGKTITVNPQMMQDIMEIQKPDVDPVIAFEFAQEWLALRCGDMDFVVDTVKDSVANNTLDESIYHMDDKNKTAIQGILAIIDTDHIALTGHSLGGATSVAEGRNRDDISAVIDFDGTMMGEEYLDENGNFAFITEPYPVPLLSFDNEEHHFSRLEAAQNGTYYENNLVLENAVCGYSTYIKGTGHMDYTDLPLISPLLAKVTGKGECDTQESMATANRIALDFLNCYLKGEGEFQVQESYE